MTFFYDLDITLLLFINRSLQNPVFDFILPILTDLHKILLVQIGFVLLWLSLLKFNRRLFFIILGLVLTFAVGDFLGSYLKDLFSRPRPDLAGINVVLKAPHLGGGSFPSNHALNNFSMAIFLSYFYPQLRYYFYIFAFVVAFSRVYCGVHYPSDILAGSLIGVFIGFLSSRYWKQVISKINRG